MIPEARLERVARPLRTAVAGMAVAVALLLLLRIPLLASFRAALVVLAAVEVVGFGAAAVSRRITPVDVATVLVKLAVLGAAYLALSS